MKLLYTTRSPYARKVQVMALEKSIDLEYVSVDLMEKSPEFVAMNPLGKVPTLILDDGSSLCDSVVICEYLEWLRPAPAFIPSDPQQRLRVYHLSRMADNLMDNTVSIFMERLQHKDDPNEAFIERRETSIKQCLKFFEERIHEMKDFDLAALSLVCAIGYIYFRLEHLGPRNGYPVLEAWYQGQLSRPSLSQTQPKM